MRFVEQIAILRNECIKQKAMSTEFYERRDSATKLRDKLSREIVENNDLGMQAEIKANQYAAAADVLANSS